MFESIRGLCRSLVTGGRWQPAMFAAKDTSIEQDFAAWDGIPLDIAARGLRGGFLANRIASSIEAMRLRSFTCMVSGARRAAQLCG